MPICFGGTGGKMGLDNKETFQNEIIVGRNPVIEALKANRDIDSVYIVSGERQGNIPVILALCKQNNVTVKNVNVAKLESICGNSVAHQGVVAVCSAAAYVSVDDILNFAKEKNEPPFIVIADQIEDPHNLGAIIRTAEACGVHGIIIPKRHGATLTATVYKTSAGALNYMPVSKVTNLSSTVDYLKSKGLWIYAADMGGQDYYKTDFSGPVALIIGSEGSGVSRLLKEKSDFVVSLFMKGKINSLNASVAAGILMYEVSRQKLTGKK